MAEAAPGTGPARGRGDAPESLRFNFSMLVLHGLLGQTGFRLVQAPTFLPHFVEVLAGNATSVGILRAVQSLGMFLSPILSARIVERRARVKSLGILFGAAMRLQVLLLALIALLAPPEQALPLVWLAVGLMGLSLGLQGVVFSFILSKVVPVERRGVLQGLRSSAAGVLLVVISFVGGWLVDRAGFPAGYGYTFLLGFGLTSLGLLAFGLLREPESSEMHADDTAIGARVRQLPGLLRREPQFRRFLVARLLGTAARGAMPMYIIFVSRRIGVTGLELGYLTMAFTMADSFSRLAWGAIADRVGFKRVFQGALASWAAGSALLLLAPSSGTAPIVFMLVGAGVGGFQLAGQSLVLEFGSERDRPMRIALSNTGSELCGMAGFLGAGLLADGVSLRLVFGLSIGLQLAAIALMTRVREPRSRVAPGIDL